MYVVSLCVKMYICSHSNMEKSNFLIVSIYIEEENKPKNTDQLTGSQERCTINPRGKWTTLCNINSLIDNTHLSK